MKRFRRRMSHTFSTQRMNSDSGLSSGAEKNAERHPYNKDGSFNFGFLTRASRHLSFSTSKLSDVYSNNSPMCGVVHEHPHIGSDGESEEASGASDEVVSPVKLRSRRVRQDINKRLSLPADVHLPESFITKQAVSPTLDGPISRTLRRQSLSEIGFGRQESYQKLRKLGEGTYATVYMGRSMLTNRLVALKEIKLEHEEGAPCTAIREVSLLKELKHNNIVTLHDIIHTEESLTLVFEYMLCDLRTYMGSDIQCEAIDKRNVKLFLFQLLRGLAYCHRRKVLHRDLKPQNLLINEIGELKLADFGLARAKSVPTKTYSNEVVTLWYRPPDVLLGSTDYSTSIDMWGVGCIFYEMAEGKPLFRGSEVFGELEVIFKKLGTPTEDTWPGITSNKEFLSYKFPIYPWEDMSLQRSFLTHDLDGSDLALDSDGLDLLEKLLKYNPKERISAREATRHSYFKEFPPEIHTLPDTASIFSVPGVNYIKEKVCLRKLLPDTDILLQQTLEPQRYQDPPSNGFQLGLEGKASSR